MARDETKLHHLPGASAGRGPPWLYSRPADLLVNHRRFSPSHSPVTRVHRSEATMSKLARALLLVATVAAMNVAGLTAVAHTQASNQPTRRPPTHVQSGKPYRYYHDALAAQAQTGQADAVEQFRRGERASQEQTATGDVGQRGQAERWNYYNHATRMSPAELKAWMQAKDRADTSTQPPAPVQPPEPSRQPAWLVVSLGGLAAALALIAGLALLAARRANRRARVEQAA